MAQQDVMRKIDGVLAYIADSSEHIAAAHTRFDISIEDLICAAVRRSLHPLPLDGHAQPDLFERVADPRRTHRRKA